MVSRVYSAEVFALEEGNGASSMCGELWEGSRLAFSLQFCSLFPFRGGLYCKDTLVW